MIRYAITGENFVAQEAARFAGNVDFVQLRAKSTDAGAMAALVREMIREVGAAKVLVSGRADVALAAGAAGVHLTSRHGELTPEQVRRVFPGATVSVSCHTLEDVSRAWEKKADLILFAPVFEKRVAGEVLVEGVGLEMLREACLAAGPVGVLALGGVTEANAGACVAVGAAGIAGIRLFR